LRGLRGEDSAISSTGALTVHYTFERRHLECEGPREGSRLIFLVFVLGLSLLLLLDCGQDFPSYVWHAYHFIGFSVIIRQPQPNLRYVG
jgi:hypothetical protein